MDGEHIMDEFTVVGEAVAQINGDGSVTLVQPDDKQATIDALDKQVRALQDRQRELEAEVAAVNESRARERNEHYNALRDQQTRFETKWQNAQDVLHREADQRGFCSDFDDIMEEIGFERRERDYHVQVKVVSYVTVGVTASGEDQASELVSGDLRSALDGYVSQELLDSLDIYDTEVYGVEEAY